MSRRCPVRERSHRVSALALAAIACSSPKPERAPAPTHPEAAVASADAAAPGDAAEIAGDAAAIDFAGYPARVQAPAGCTVSGPWKHADQPTALAFEASGKPYASVFQVARADATLAGDTVFVDALTKSIRIAGYVDKAKVRLHALAPFVVAGWVAPGPSAPLAFVTERDGVATFEVPLPAGVKAKAPVRGERPCSELGTAATATFRARDAIAAEEIETAMLRANRAIPISVERGKPAVAVLRYKVAPSVDVLEKVDEDARIAVGVTSLNPAENVVVFGWVAAAAIEPQGGGFGGSWATGGEPGTKRARPRRDTKLYTCTSELPLAVELGGERRTVGTLAAGFVVEALPVIAGDFVEVRLPGAHAELAAGARWLVGQAALARCAETTRP